MSAPTTSATYQVLARKYRPTTFDDMIGQDSMVTTLSNAFRTGRIAHAFMLTGVRGIGKTTTARLLARALNYETESQTSPSVDLSTPGLHCEAIMHSSHMDVLEMDAASRTGVENMRELLDSVRYAPVQARYKVYIIDEVHMLSTGAFNALLKTLEEPPDHAKFIFATTEIRKVPITVLSRCQRFDLRRVDVAELTTHLKNICARESVKVTDDGLGLIARAAEGSVRDALSLLDQAIVQADPDSPDVTAEQVRTMLGLADRERTLDLFAMAMKADSAGLLTEIKSQYDDGADPSVIMSDLLNICHMVTRAKAMGDAADYDTSPDQAKRLITLSETLSQGQLTRAWQILLASYHDVRVAPDPLATAEMALLKLAVAAELPPPELVARLLENLPQSQSSTDTPHAKTDKTSSPSQNASLAHASQGPAQNSSHTQTQTYTADNGPDPRYDTHQNGQAAQMRVMPDSVPPQSVPEPNFTHVETLTDLTHALQNTDIELKYDIEKHVRLIRMKSGSMTIQTLSDAPVSLVGRMVAALRDITGQMWLIDQEDGEAQASISETRKAAKLARDKKERAHPAFSHPLLANASRVDIRDVEHTQNLDTALEDPTSNVIDGDFS